MALVRWSPFQELADIRREMQQLWRQMPGWSTGGQGGEVGEGEGRFMPAVDVGTSGEDLILKVELPGIDPEKDVDISLEGNMLHISGKRQAERKEEKEGYYFQEMRYGSFERVFNLPEGIGEDAISAEYRDGLLEVTVAGGAKQLQAPEGKRIPIKKSEGQLPKAA